MSIDELSLRQFKNAENAIDIAFPVFAIECEVNPPLNKKLDAYETAVLKLVKIGLSVSSIGKTINITESLAESILFQLAEKKYISKKKGQGWIITENGKKFMNGIEEVRPSTKSEYGFMFVSALKKDVLQYFYKGDISNIQKPQYYCEKLTKDNREDKTFVFPKINDSKLNQSYKKGVRNSNLYLQQIKKDVSPNEAQELYANLESFDEIYDDKDVDNKKDVARDLPRNNGFVRKLKTEPQKFYLKMRVVFDEHSLGGYIVESPLDYGGVDNEFFVRQFKWLLSVDDVYYGKDRLKGVVKQKLETLCNKGAGNLTDKNLDIKIKLPLLAEKKDRYPDIYEVVCEILRWVDVKNKTLMDMENIIIQFNSKLIERLYNDIFLQYDKQWLEDIQQRAKFEIKAIGVGDFMQHILNAANIKEETVLNGKRLNGKWLTGVINLLGSTNGNNILAKLTNLLVINYYDSSNEQLKNYVMRMDFIKTIEIVSKLNCARNSSGHDSKKKIAEDDYNFYMKNIYEIANQILEAQKEI